MTFYGSANRVFHRNTSLICRWSLRSVVDIGTYNITVPLLPWRTTPKFGVVCGYKNVSSIMKTFM